MAKAVDEGGAEGAPGRGDDLAGSERGAGTRAPRVDAAAQLAPRDFEVVGRRAASGGVSTDFLDLAREAIGSDAGQ